MTQPNLRCRNRLIAVLSLLGVGLMVTPTTSWAQQRPGGKKPAKKASKKPTKGKPTKRKSSKGKPTKPTAARPYRPARLATAASVEAQGKAIADLAARQQTLLELIADLRKDLQGAGLIAKAAPPSLDPIQKAEKTKLEQQLAEVVTKRKALQKAIDEGLDPAVVKDSADRLDAEIRALRQAIAQIKPAQATVRSKLGTELDTLRAAIGELEKKLAALEKAKKAAPPAPPKPVAKKKSEKEKTPLLELLPVDLFAFGDFFYAFRETGTDGFEIGQLELDVELPIVDYLSVAAGLAYDGGIGAFGIGAFTADGKFAGSEDGHLIKTKAIKTSGVMFGQFDVPFGIAYHQYPSLDRRFVTDPLAVAHIHDNWNDLGAQLYLDANWIKAVAFMVNGFGYETQLADGTVAPREPSMAGGGRLGIAPFEGFEFGGSVAVQHESDADVDMILAGGDVALEVVGLAVRGEYLFKKSGLVAGEASTTHGFYAQSMYDFEPVYLIGRYSQVILTDEEDPHQLSGGVGVAVHEKAEIRFEYTTDLKDGGSIGFLQIAGGTSWQPSGLRR